MLAGAVDFLTKPFTSEELSSSIHRVHEANRRRPPAQVSRAPEGLPPAAATGVHVPSQQGKLLLVYSPKGGTGCSTVATNLAIAIAQVTAKKVALVDASLQFGDADVLLNLQGSQSIVDATKRIDELDSDLLTVLMSTHPSGIKVLAAPPSPVEFDSIGTEVYKEVLARLQKTFDYIVLDTWSYLDDTVLCAIDQAERVLLVMTPEIPSIKSTKQFFEIAEALEFPLDRIDLILNKVYPRDGIRVEQIENSMKHTVRAQFDFEPQAIRKAVNEGTPVTVGQSNHPMAQAFLQLAEQEVALTTPEPVVVAEATPQAERTRRSGLFGRLKK
jgi:pilus assembly protein CpaE